MSRRGSLVDVAKRFAAAHDEFERFAARRDVSIGGVEWNELWRRMYQLREELNNLALRRFSAFEPPYFHPPIRWDELEDGKPKKRRKPRLRVMKGGKTP